MDEKQKAPAATEAETKQKVFKLISQYVDELDSAKTQSEIIDLERKLDLADRIVRLYHLAKV